jgi:hypothetical protein
MKTKRQKIAALFAISIFGFFAAGLFFSKAGFENAVSAQTSPTPKPTAEFRQAEAIAKLREQIKGREKEPAGEVFKNIQTLKQIPAGNLLAIMEFGFSRSLGVNCTHCHTPEKWEAEDKTQKQTAREMWAMVGKINGELLKNIKNLKSENPIVNCTTCHRGEIKPALNLPMP